MAKVSVVYKPAPPGRIEKVIVMNQGATPYTLGTAVEDVFAGRTTRIGGIEVVREPVPVSTPVIEKVVIECSVTQAAMIRSLFGVGPVYQRQFIRGHACHFASTANAMSEEENVTLRRQLDAALCDAGIEA